MKSDVIGGAHDHHMPDVFFVEYAASVFRNMSWMNTEKMVSSLNEYIIMIRLYF